MIGASFIGLESRRRWLRGLEVNVVAPEAVPMERVFGAEVGGLVRRVDEQHGVGFHLGTTAAAIDARGVDLADGGRLEADLVVAGRGAAAHRARRTAGIAVDRGVTPPPVSKPLCAASGPPAPSPAGPTG